MKPHKNAVLEALGQSNGERSIARYLKRNPYLVLSAFGEFGNHGNYLLAEFGLGKAFHADFVILQGYSGGWRVDLVELEPVIDPLFNKDRTPTKRLRIAQKQIADWRDYERSNGTSLRRQLADATKDGDLIKRCSDLGDPCTMSGQRLRDPDSFVDYRYHIVIGRRHLLSKDAQRLRCRSFRDDSIDIATYDRIVDVAAEFDSDR
jgi:Domain of unknown function (DUF4263)